MFSRWNLVRNPFDTSPISLGTLDWFVGRTKEVEVCRRVVSERSVVLVEGGLGVGTTSFGNATRFGAERLTPRMEIAVYRGWNAQTLLENVLVAVLHDLLDIPGAARSKAVRKARTLVQRVEQTVHSAGVSVLGFGGQVSRNVAVTQPGIVPMETLRQSLLALAEAFPPKQGSASFAVQLNNLDPELTFSEDELSSFLNDIRDSLQLPGFSWLLVGKTGLARFVTHRVPRLRSIVSHDVLLPPLSFREVQAVVNKRLDACALPGRKARNPIEPGLLARIHEASGGSLRETFIICSKLCLAIAGDPMYEAITEAEACTLLAELSAARLAGVGKGTLRYAILKTLGEAGEATQKQLAERLGKNQTAISRAAKGLLESELIHRNKQGREVKYRPMAEISLAAGSL